MRSATEVHAGRSVRWRLSLGPVFAYEWIGSSRRQQAYALRSAFVLFLLMALAYVWLNTKPYPARKQHPPDGRGSARWFFQAVIGTQLALVLLAAPGGLDGQGDLPRQGPGYADAHAHDRPRRFRDCAGRQPVAARLVPVVGLVACTVPMMELLTLLGGIAPGGGSGAHVRHASLGVACPRLFAWLVVLALGRQNPRGASGHVRSVVSLAAGPSLAGSGRHDNGLARAASATLDQPILSCVERIVPRRSHVAPRSRIPGRDLGHLGALDRLGAPQAARRICTREDLAHNRLGTELPGPPAGKIDPDQCDRRSLEPAHRWTETRCCGASAAAAVRRPGQSWSR